MVTVDNKLGEKIIKDVLIIDDEAEVCEVIELYCENLGCFRNIIIASDGSIASSKLMNQRFALILLDINMPKKSGVDLLREFNENHPNDVSQVMIISGELDKAKLEYCIRTGVKHFLIKPFDETQFQQKAIEVLKTYVTTKP